MINFWSRKINYELARGLRSLYVLLLALIVVSPLVSQHYPQYSQFMYNRYGINSAYGGLESSLSVTAGIRSQWSQFVGSPKTQFINAHLPLYFLNGSVGVAIENEQLGVSQRKSFSSSFNYVQETSFGLVSFSGKLGVQQVSLNSSDIRTPDGHYVDNTINHNDPLFLASNLNGFAPIWGLGLYVAAQGLEVGVALENLPSAGIKAGGSRFESTSFSTFFATYNYAIDESIVISPSLLVKSDFTQTQTDFGGIVTYNQVFGGATLRGYNSSNLDAVNFIIGTTLNKHIRLSYSFDMGLSGLRNFHEGTHEFILNYNLRKEIKTGELPRIIYNPRYN